MQYNYYTYSHQTKPPCYNLLIKTQILYIHGAESFSNYEDFLNYLKTTPIYNPHGENSKRWRDTIREEFSSECDVLFPTMPNKQNAHYTEWKIWFERYFEFLTGEVILIGHSQGGYFLVKYLTENAVTFPIKALFLISTPFNNKVYGYNDSSDFDFNTETIDTLEKIVKSIFILHSKDDTIVPFSQAEAYMEKLPTAKFISFTDRGHFISPEFPEIIEEIRKIL